MGEMSKADCDVLQGVREILSRLAALEMGMAMMVERIERLEVDHADDTGEWLGPTHDTVVLNRPVITYDRVDVAGSMTQEEMDAVHKYLADRWGIDLEDAGVEA